MSRSDREKERNGQLLRLMNVSTVLGIRVWGWRIKEMPLWLSFDEYQWFNRAEWRLFTLSILYSAKGLKGVYLSCQKGVRSTPPSSDVRHSTAVCCFVAIHTLWNTASINNHFSPSLSLSLCFYLTDENSMPILLWLALDRLVSLSLVLKLSSLNSGLIVGRARSPRLAGNSNWNPLILMNRHPTCVTELHLSAAATTRSLVFSQYLSHCTSIRWRIKSQSSRAPRPFPISSNDVDWSWRPIWRPC